MEAGFSGKVENQTMEHHAEVVNGNVKMTHPGN